MEKKTAQALKGRHKARRLFNPTGKALTVLNPAFKKVIRDLDKVDKKVRKEAEDLNYYIGMGRSFIRRKDYLTAATYLVKFHEKIKLIHHQLNTFNSDISESNRKFLLKQFKNKDKKKLFNYDPSKEIESIKLVDDGLVNNELVVNAASFKDWWRTPGRFKDLYHNLTDNKSKSMRALERNFSDASLSQLKTDTKEMLKDTEELYSGLLENFHRMGSAWASRNVGAYINEIQDINSKYLPYHTSFVTYHTNNIKPMKEAQEKIDKETSLAEQEARKKSLENGEYYKEKDPFTNTHTFNGEESLPSWLGPLKQPPISDAPSSEESPSGSIQTKSAPIEESAPLTHRSPGSETLPRPSPPPSVHTQGPVMQSGPSTAKYPFWNAPLPKSEPGTAKYPFFTAPPKSVPPPSAPFSFTAEPGHDFSDVDHLAEYDLTKRKANDDFLNRIEKLSNEEDIIREILSYSEEVEKYSENESLKLLAVAEGMIEKNSGAFDKIKKKLNLTPKDKKQIVRPDPPSSEHPISSEPETEDLISPGTVRSPSTNISQPNKPSNDILQGLLPSQNKFHPIEHGIPQGDVNKRWFEVPFLAQKKSSDLKLSSETATHIVKKMVKYLHNKYLPYTHIENLESKFVQALKNGIVNGQLLTNLMCEDNHNGRDCKLAVYSYIKLEDIDSTPAFTGVILTFVATCRLTTFEGDIIIKTISDPKLHHATK